MEQDVVEQAHQIYFNVVVSHGGGDKPWTPEQRAQLRRALELLEPLEAAGELGPEGVQLMASLCLELGNDEREEHLLKRGLERYAGAAALHADYGASQAALGRWSEAIAHLSAAALLGVNDPDEQWAVAVSQLIDTLAECGNADGAERLRAWALTQASDEKARAWLEE